MKKRPRNDDNLSELEMLRAGFSAQAAIIQKQSATIKERDEKIARLERNSLALFKIVAGLVQLIAYIYYAVIKPSEAEKAG